MKAANVNPPRFREAPHTVDARAAVLADAAREVPPLPPEALARIKAGVLARGPSRSFRTLPLGVRFASLAIILLASAATASATIKLWRRHVASTAAAQKPVHRRASPARPAPRPEETAADPIPSPAPRAAAVRPTAPAPHPRRVALATPAEARAAKDEPATETEAQLLAGALARLRQEHDATGALALLDQYARAFPRGMLEAEAFGARLEAVIELDDHKTALRLLDGRKGFAGRLGGQQLLTRAELRASAGRYADALGDFDRLLGPQAAAALPADLERALYGRAVCLGRLGKDDRARADLNAYARQFPQGKHAAEVARLLAGTRLEDRP